MAAKEDKPSRQRFSDEEYRKRKEERNKALRKSFEADHPHVKLSSGGADIDAEIEALQARMTAVEQKNAEQDQRLAALEAGGGTEPEPPEPEPPEPPSDKRFPDVNDPMCGVPAGTSLTNAGATTISQNGAKVSGKKFTGRVTIDADDVELFNCEIYHGDWWGIMINGARAKIHHCFIHSDSTSGNSGVNTADGTEITYCKFRGFENAFNIAGDDNKIEWNDCDGLKGNSSSHYDTLQADGGFRNLTIRHNRLDNDYGQTAATMIDNYFGKIENVTIEDNWLGGGGYPCYLDGSFKGSANAVNVKYTNNVIKRGGYGYFYWKSAGSGCSHTGNVDASSGAPCD